MLKAIVWGSLILVAGVAMGGHPALAVVGAMMTGVLVLAASPGGQRRKY